MPFFSPYPAPDNDPPVEEKYYAFPGQEPDNALPGLGAPGVTLVRTETTAVQLSMGGAYPQGLALAIKARLHPDHVGANLWDKWHRGANSQLRIGFEWPDGRRVEAGTTWTDHARPGAGYQLSSVGGGGGGLSYKWDYWLWPLPPAGLVTVHVLWEDRGIPETATAVDLTPFVACAAAATVLWPLPDPPEDFPRCQMPGPEAFSRLVVGSGEDQPEPGSATE